MCTARLHLLKDTQIRLMALLFPSVLGITGALAELIVECHSTVKSMRQVTVAMKCSMHKLGKEDIFLHLVFHLPMVMGLSWVAANDISVWKKEEWRISTFCFFALVAAVVICFDRKT